MKDIVATIITYNPETDLLIKNIEAILPQVDKVVVYDNNSSNINGIEKTCIERSVELIKYDDNYGIAKPLHDGVLLAEKLGYEYILTLDQDSVAGKDMVLELKKAIETDSKIAMAGPNTLDTRVGREIIDNIEQIRKVAYVISSGALARVKIIKNIGNYIPEMFIDTVDYEICYRIQENGYWVVNCNKAILSQQFGYPKKHKFFFKTIYTPNYSVQRVYYQARNVSFCAKRYPSNEHARQTKRWIFFNYRMKILLFEKDKFKKLKAMRKGKKNAKQFYNEMMRKYFSNEKV